MSNPLIIHWFRQDLRLHDNPALTAAAKEGTVLPVYILDDTNAGAHRIGGASRVWLHHSLQALNARLDGKLAVYQGDAASILLHLAETQNVRAIHWNRCYEPWRMERDARIKEALKGRGVEATSHNGSLLFEPWEIRKPDGTPYRVFTPFFRKGCLQAPPPRTPLPVPEPLQLSPSPADALLLEALVLLPGIRWDTPMMQHWTPGEDGARHRLSTFLDHGLNGYKEGRNFPAKPFVSRLSPHLHCGELSPNQVWYAAMHQGERMGLDSDLDHFKSELCWREFSYHLLYQYPDLPERNLQSRFDAFPWREDAEALERWQKGQTGYPIVDAGMRELWQTGYMHNRVRMIVGSFLVKNLLLDWRLGERWFWDCLFDADLANNAASWQWVAGSGADAAPYFRVFNPVMQGQKFDVDGDYTRRFVPELRELSNTYLFAPWEAPPEVLRGAGVKLGTTYPNPIVDMKASRDRALDAFATLKKL
jgi:deoxyribodipyrimidine photo-lyase